MKKLFLMTLAVTATFIGCSDSYDHDKMNPLVEETLSVEQMCSDVPMHFAYAEMINDTIANDGVTRAALGEMVTYPGLGLFCLAKRPINDGITEKRNPSWSKKSSALINSMSLWKDNVPVSLKYKEGTNGSKVLWDVEMNEDYFPYYPDKDWFAYGFVLYYPRTENIVYTQTTLTAYIKLDGSKRVFYSMAKAPKTILGDDTDLLGFSKSYYQAIDPEPGVDEWIYPYFTFQALTSGVRFAVYSKETPVTNLHVEKMEFDDFPCIMQLGLATMVRYADKTAYDMKSSIATNPFIKNDSIFREKELSQFPGFTSAFGHFELSEEDGSSIAGQKNADGSYKYTLTKDPMLVGGTVYIPPVYAGHSRQNIKLNITLADDAGNTYKTDAPIVLQAPQHGYQRGTSYTYTLYLNNPAEVAKNAEMATWRTDNINIEATSTNWERTN